MIYIIKEKKTAVTKHYLDMISRSIHSIYGDVRYIDSADLKIVRSKTDIIITGSILQAFKLILLGSNRFVIWIQGILPEESFMRHESVIRKAILEKIEHFVLKRSPAIVLISESMKKHYESKYKIDFGHHYHIMPCFNTEIHEKSFHFKDKYKNNVFAYIGSLAPWQGFEHVLDCYHTIEEMGVANTKLLILTSEQDTASKLVKKYNIVNYEIGYTDPEQLHDRLASVKFGFILREDNLVNRVATPTKISSYLANGLIPIYNDCLEDFHLHIRNYHFQLNYDSNEFWSDLKSMLADNINSQDVFREYSQVYRQYFSAEAHQKALQEMLMQVFP